VAERAVWRQYQGRGSDVKPQRENAMAKGQMKSNKETKKPKAEKPKGGGSAYKLAQGKGGQAPIGPTGKK
jgi:hypothetical protein